MLDWISAIFVLAGAFFFFAGTVGLLRFPDAYARLHSLSKADNMGLGLVVVGMMLQAGTPAVALKMLLIWLLVLAAGATAAGLVANAAQRSGLSPWRRP